MRIGWIGSALLAAVLGGSPLYAQAQDDMPRMANGKPDFSGIYTAPSTVNATGPRGNLIFNEPNLAPLLPGAEELLYVARTGDARVDEPRAMCLPAGFPSGMLYILPIQMIQNEDQLSKDYSRIQDRFRPGHADYTYQQKYGIRDYRGGGRSSARETWARRLCCR